MNRVVHFEIHAADPDKLQAFYEGLFGWKFQKMGSEFANYRIIITGENKLGELMTPEMMGINGGMTDRRGAPAESGAPVNAFVNVIGVEDVDATFAKGLSLGGSEAIAPMDMPGVGRLAYLKDPENSIFGIIKPTMPPGGPQA